MAKGDSSTQLGRLAQLWMASQPVIAAFVRGMVFEQHDVEDLVQQVAETCARKFREFDADGGPREFRSWTLTIARFEVLRYYQRQKRSAVGFSADTLEIIADEFERSDDRTDDRLEALRHCLTKITDRNRQLIEMKYFRVLSAAQIADRLGLSAGAVRVALCRTRETLAVCIRNQLGSCDHA